MDTRSMAEAKSWRTHSSRARIAAETLISTRRRYGCCRTRATRRVSGFFEFSGELTPQSCAALSREFIEANWIYLIEFTHEFNWNGKVRSDERRKGENGRESLVISIIDSNFSWAFVSLFLSLSGRLPKLSGKSHASLQIDRTSARPVIYLYVCSDLKLVSSPRGHRLSHNHPSHSCWWRAGHVIQGAVVLVREEAPLAQGSDPFEAGRYVAGSI